MMATVMTVIVVEMSPPGCDTLGSPTRLLPPPPDTGYEILVATGSDGRVAVAERVNQLLMAAQGEYCLFLGHRVMITAALVAAHLVAQHAAGGAITIGSPAHEGSAGNAGPAIADCTGGNFSAPRAAILAAGGWARDLPLREELDLAHRLHVAGLPIVIAPGATTQASRPATGTDETAIAVGAADVDVYRRRPALLSYLPLGRFDDTSLRALLLRRLLLTWHVPPSLLLRLMSAVKSRSWGREWDRFRREYHYWWGARRAMEHALWLRLSRGPVILMYHAFGPHGERPSRYIVPAERFARQLAWLALCRYRVLGLDEVVACRRAGRLLPPRTVVLTADDGYVDTLTVAAPLLRHRRFPATVFVVSDALGGTNDWDVDTLLTGRRIATAAAIRAVRCAGDIRFGAHTRHHPSLTAIASARAREEIVGGRAALEAALGEEVTMFAYPYGHYDASGVALVEEAGYAGACGGFSGINDPGVPPYTLRRAEIRGTDSLFTFAMIVACGRTRPLARLRGGR